MSGAKVDLKAIPNAVWFFVTAAFLGVVAALVVLSITGSDATEFRSFLNLIMNAAMLLISGSGAVYAGAAAKNAQDAKEQTNGKLDVRIAEQVANQLVKHGMTSIDANSVDIKLKGVTDDGRPVV